MDANEVNGTFQSMPQRVASTYRRMLAEFCPIPAGEVSVESQADLRAFFQSLYGALYDAPGAFGLPQSPDLFIAVDHDKEGLNKTDLKRMLDKHRKLVEDGLGFLSAVGQAGRLALEGDALVIEPGSPALDYLKKKPGKAWLKGLNALGLTLEDGAGPLIARSARFPQMFPALKALAEACAGCQPPELGRVFFARCDFRALGGDFTVDALDLYGIFPPDDYARAVRLHAFFTGRGYQPQVSIGRLFNWEVKYQGKKSVKSTPLFQVDFDERFRRQMRPRIKCASSQRVVPLIARQSPALQADFARRSFRCLECHWCANNKTLGPVEFIYQGEKRTICWYVNSDIDDLTNEMEAVVQEYALMHEALGEA